MSNQVLIIAEAGVNHNGDLAMAKELIDVAASAKVDMVKFQTFKADTIVSKKARKADYQIENLNDGKDSQYEMLKNLELSHSDHLDLMDYARKQGIKFFSTAFDTEGLDYLNALGFDMFKVPSGEITNYRYLKKLSEFGKPIILSTGMANLKEIKEAVEVLTRGTLSKADIVVLHCNTEYPTPMQDVNLKAMRTIADEIGVQIGYSDHTLGIEVPIAAVALGAVVIEKHFTLSRSLKGPDHPASLEPEELKAMTRTIRNIELAMSGDGTKVPSSSEIKNISIARKGLYYRENLSAGHMISEEDIVILRPTTEISAMEFPRVIDRELKKPVTKEAPISKQDFED